jgi:hypothetical protein
VTIKLSERKCKREIELLKVTNIICEMKNILDKMKSRLHTAKANISEFKDTAIRTTTNKTQKKEEKVKVNRAPVSYETVSSSLTVCNEKGDGVE